ncbi:hypothetical protein GF362_06965 [Candidatus Dojkabacteria bacterium]|nr:hypothetical protein [Candidatus Dojkabacteria bacterium]
MFQKSPFKNHNLILTATAVILAIVGLITIFSTTYNATNITQGKGLFGKQIVLLGIGFVVYIVITFFDYRWFKDLKVLGLIYIFTLFLLLYVKFFTPEISETNRWIQVGPITIQPAEYAKITVVLITSSILGFSEIINEKYQFKKPNTLPKAIRVFIATHPYLSKIFLSLILISPIILLVLAQPAFGNTIIIALLWGSLVLFFYPDKKELVALVILFLIAFSVGWKLFIGGGFGWFISIIVTIVGLNAIYWTFRPKIVESVIILILGFSIVPISLFGWNKIMRDYQKERVETFLDPSKDPQGTGWQVKQSKIAIGSGRVFGRGYMQGTQSGLKLLPYPHTDFIFAAFAEQFGFVWSAALILILVSLPLQIFFIADDHTDKYATILASGVGTMLLIHIFINVGMNLGKLPVTGIPLPLISSGGSSVLVTMILLGIVQNTLKFQYEEKNVRRVGYK